MPFPIPSVRIAQASPSVSLEKGSYRMRAPPSRSRPARLHTAKFRSQSQSSPDQSIKSLGTVAEFVPASYEKRMALLVALLTCAMLASFGTAWYLWTTRCVKPYLLHSLYHLRTCRTIAWLTGAHLFIQPFCSQCPMTRPRPRTSYRTLLLYS